MNLWCKLGFHDYETIKSLSIRDIENDIAIKRGITPILDYYTTGITSYFSQKICLNCCKYIDEITPEIKRQEKVVDKSNIRENKLKEILSKKGINNE
ncbi:MAG: hypothetical protein M0R17_05360 [Candidatus Omnitrophica bacterium]|jgi:hypothetical protein|nr:hypothetical protein [Candidatus Omnitrophota bacterium]